MFPEARIEIGLRTAHGRVAEVAIRSTRMVQAARLFAGRRPAEVLALLPTVFSLCGTAQRLACLQAVETACGMAPSPDQTRRRRFDVLAETVTEHLLGMIRDWPAMMGETVDLAPAKILRLAMAAVNTDAPRALTVAGEVFTEVLGAPRTVLDGPEPFQSWMASGARPAARLLASLAPESLAGFGAADFRPMPPSGPPDIGHRLAIDGSGDYVARPDCQGVVLETGPLARHAGHPVVAPLLVRYGSGILPRLAARLVDVAAALRELKYLVQDLPDDQAPPHFTGSGAGLGMVEAARGLLAHRVELEDGRVTSYRILAPTEWNFHPAGPLAAGLREVPAGDGLERQAHLLVHALDPCVACTVLVE